MKEQKKKLQVTNLFLKNEVLRIIFFTNFIFSCAENNFFLTCKNALKLGLL